MFFFLQDIISSKSAKNYQDGEYAVIKIYPYSRILFCVHRSTNLCPAFKKVRDSLQNREQSKKTCSLAYYAIKKFHQGIFYPINEQGEIGWELVESNNFRYADIAYKPSTYPNPKTSQPTLMYRIAITSSPSEMDSRYQDFNRLIKDNFTTKICRSLILSSVISVKYQSTDCRSCQNYHGENYNGTKLVCAMHPYGFEGRYCPDYID